MKRALVCGINYKGSGNDLKGCINDANNMYAMLKERGFDEVQLLLEDAATTAGIKSSLNWLVTGVQPGDVIVFHYSGHGSQLPSRVEADGFEEIICPYDLNWIDKVITDDDLRNVFNKVPRGANTTVVLDCCNSGSGLDQVESLQLVTRGLLTIEEADDTASRYLPPPPEVLEQLKNRELVEWSTSRDVNAWALLIAGCQSHQTSADAYIEGTYQGAATYALLRSLDATPDISYRDLVQEMNDYMDDKGFSQNPQLDGFSGLYDKEFLQPFGTVTSVPSPVVEEPLVMAPPAPGKDDKGDHLTLIVGIIVAVAVVILFSL